MPIKFLKKRLVSNEQNPNNAVLTFSLPLFSFYVYLWRSYAAAPSKSRVQSGNK